MTNQALADVSNGGNSWGNNKLRIERTSTGDLFAVYPAAGADSMSKQWVLMHRPPAGPWIETARGVAGREPPNLLVSPGDRLNLFTQPRATPTLVQDGGANGLLPFSAAAIPGGWFTTNFPYSGATVRQDNGDLFFAETREELSQPASAFYWSYRSADTGIWRSVVTQKTMYRYAYLLPVASTNGGADFAIAASTDVLWSTLGYQQPAGSFAYVYDRVSLFYTSDYRSGELTEKLIYREEQKQNAYLNVFASDAYRDSRGRVHVIYSVQGPSTNQQIVGHHAVLQGGTLVADVTLANVSCGNEGRVVQDTTGQYYLLTWCGTSLYLWPADSVNGTQIGDPVVLDLSQYPPKDWSWLSIVRGGTALADYVDGAYAGSNDTQLIYFRIRLRS